MNQDVSIQERGAAVPAVKSLKYPKILLGMGFLLGWMVDFLFWGHDQGISIPLWIILALTALLILAAIEKVKPDRYSYGLILLIVLAAAFTILRLEPLTVFLNTVAALLGLILLAATFVDGHWVYYRLLDYVLPILRVIFGGLQRIRAVIFPFSRKRLTDASGRQTGWKTFFSVLRGALFALPILLILGSLLVSADEIFANKLKFMLDWFSMNNLVEYSFRLIFILILSLLFVGVLIQALLPGKITAKPDPTRRFFQPFLGWIETAMIIGSINLMFLLFVVIQFNYLFGGETNIHFQGFNYAEYAQRGFSELVAVAVLSFLIYLGLEGISRRETKSQLRWFSGLSILLMAQVLVMLASSFQRLALYEAAYGFTRLRMYTHVFIICLAVFLLIMMILEMTGIKGRFGLVFVLFCYSFAFALGLTNVDGMIARLNLSHSTRPLQDSTLDYDYLRALSMDAAGVLMTGFENEDLSSNTHEKIGAVLACRLHTIQQLPQTNWRSIQPVESLMDARILAMETQLAADFAVQETKDGVLIKTAKNEWSCQERWDDWID